MSRAPSIRTRRRPVAASARSVVESLERRQLLTTFNPADGPGLASALSSAQLGDTIILNAGSTYTGNFTLKNKTTGSGWITIQSSNLASLPIGKRVTPADAANMPKIVSAGSNVPAIRAEYGAAIGAHHFKLLGCEVIGPANNSDLVNLIELGTTDSIQNTITMMPHDFVIDRCYIHANITDTTNNLSSQHLRRGIALNAGATDITNCWISEIHDVGSGDSQAIGGSNGAGPYNILNNHLEAASENILFGGSGAYVPNTVPSDIVIRGNHFYKPTSWMGVWTQEKNLFELKMGRRVLIEGNIFENCWTAAQSGVAILFKLDQYNASRPWQVTEDITFRNNIVRHAAGAMTIQGRDYTNNSPYGLVRRITVTNNLFDDINKNPWATWSDPNLIGGNVLYMTQGPIDVTFSHNTISNTRTPIIVDTPQYPDANFIYQNNIVAHNTYGVFSSEYGTGDNTITNYFDNNGGGPFTKNVMMGGPSGSYTKHPGNYFPSTWAAVGFVDQASGDYHLTNASPYHNAATDGTDIGANIDTINGFVYGVLTGVWPFAYKVGSTLYTRFDGTGANISLTTSGANILAATTGASTQTFSGVTAVTALDSPADEHLQINGTLQSSPLAVEISGGNNYADVLSGSYAFATDLAGSSGSRSRLPLQRPIVTVAAGATANFNASQHLASLSVTGNANLSAGGGKVIVTNAVSAAGKLNLNDNDLILDYTGSTPIGSWNGTSYTGVAGLLASGNHGGDYTGNGIITTQSNAVAPNSLTTLGVGEASDVLGISGSQTALYGSETVDATAVIVKYTYAGDANLDGQITGDDYFQIDSAFPSASHGWANGDFNFDGVVNGDDYFLIDSNFPAQGLPL